MGRDETSLAIDVDHNYSLKNIHPNLILRPGFIEYQRHPKPFQIDQSNFNNQTNIKNITTTMEQKILEIKEPKSTLRKIPKINECVNTCSIYTIDVIARTSATDRPDPKTLASWAPL